MIKAVCRRSFLVRHRWRVVFAKHFATLIFAVVIVNDGFGDSVIFAIGKVAGDIVAGIL